MRAGESFNLFVARVYSIIRCAEPRRGINVQALINCRIGQSGRRLSPVALNSTYANYRVGTQRPKLGSQ